MPASKSWWVWKCLKVQLREGCFVTCVFLKHAAIIYIQSTGRKVLVLSAFVCLVITEPPTLLFLPVPTTAWQPLIHLHFSVIFQQCNWEALWLHKSGRLEKSMDTVCIILNYCSCSLITSDRLEFKYNHSHLLNMNYTVIYVFW